MSKSEHTRSAPSTSAKSPPEGALTWGDAAERSNHLIQWKVAVRRATSNAGSVKLAWVLHDLFYRTKRVKTGFVTPSDEFLKRELNCSRQSVQNAFTILKEIGAVIRVGDPNRRIYLGAAVIGQCKPRVDTASVHTPFTPLFVQTGFTHNNNKQPDRRPRSQLNAARRSAALDQGTVNVKTARELLDEQYGSAAPVDTQPPAPLSGEVVALRPIELALPPSSPPNPEYRRRHFLPDDFRLSEAMVATGNELAGWDGERCRLEFRKFVAHYRASGDKYFDWVETFTKWCIRGAEFDKRDRGKANGSKPSFVDVALSYGEGGR